jgi:hypothetical protein
MSRSKGPGSFYRSAISGRFVKESTANRHPDTTLRESRSGEPTGSHRSAKTGRFVTKAYAARHPRTTVDER